MNDSPTMCLDCGKRITLTATGLLRQHGHPARRCRGSATIHYGYLQPTTSASCNQKPA